MSYPDMSAFTGRSRYISVCGIWYQKSTGVLRKDDRQTRLDPVLKDTFNKLVSCIGFAVADRVLILRRSDTDNELRNRMAKIRRAFRKLNTEILIRRVRGYGYVLIDPE